MLGNVPGSVSRVLVCACLCVYCACAGDLPEGGVCEGCVSDDHGGREDEMFEGTPYHVMR